MTRTRNPAPSLETFEFLLEEGEAYLMNLIQLSHKLRKMKRGTDRYFDVMAEVSAEASRVHARMESIMDEDEAITDAMPDDD